MLEQLVPMIEPKPACREAFYDCFLYGRQPVICLNECNVTILACCGTDPSLRLSEASTDWSAVEYS